MKICSPSKLDIPYTDLKLNYYEYEEIYNEYKPILEKSLIRDGCLPHEAEDIVHEAFFKLINLDGNKKPSFAKSYLFTISKNILVDRKRRTNKSPVRSIEDESKASNYSCQRASPEEELSAKQQLKLMNESLEELPEKCRTSFMLYKVAEWEYSAISSYMGVSESMIRKYVLKALRHCAIVLDKSR